MRPYQFIVDEKGNQTAAVIDINDFRQIQKLLEEPQDSDGIIFEARRDEESIPIEKCDEILERIRQIKTKQ